MSKKTILLQRLDDIAISLRNTNKARAMIAFGSVGVETERIDEYSDLDFLVVAKKGCKLMLGSNLDWLSSVSPISYCFIDRHGALKIFQSDGIFCDFGICEENEVSEIPHATGRIIWCEDDFDENLRMSSKHCEYETVHLQNNINELLINLYIGLCRYARGEKLAAHRFIQGYALDCLLGCSGFMSEEADCVKDVFAIERRYEMRFPKLAGNLPLLIQGYEKCPESAMAALALMESCFKVDPFVKTQITSLADECLNRAKRGAISE